MRATVRFSFEKDWRFAPLAFWVHLPNAPGGAGWAPPAPQPVPQRGYVCLRVRYLEYELLFSAPAQLDHCIAILASRPMPTSRQLSQRRAAAAGPNGHWLSRLPARLKAPRRRERLVQQLRAIRARLKLAPDGHSFYSAPANPGRDVASTD